LYFNLSRYFKEDVLVFHTGDFNATDMDDVAKGRPEAGGSKIINNHHSTPNPSLRVRRNLSIQRTALLQLRAPMTYGYTLCGYNSTTQYTGTNRWRNLEPMC
jgi:hypothetical protein